MLPVQFCLNQSISDHDNAGSNCSEMKSDNVTAVPVERPAAPLMLANVMGSWRTKSHVHDGCVIPSMRVPSPNVGGKVNPRRTSRSRRPKTAVSTVSMMESYPLLAARDSMSLTSSRSFHTYTWNHFGPLLMRATSSMERVDKVERQ